MKILNVLIPSVLSAHEDALAFYRDTLDLPVLRDVFMERLGFHMTLVAPMLLLHSGVRDALDLAARVHAILIVDDIDAFWNRVMTKVSVVIPLEEIETGRRFIATHPDQKTFEYLQLRA
ncbi:putative glyoxalase superfamily protein PhnB [Burkholderia ambifaria]|nr:VOC family protein [Burkholderia ambifaria]MDR6500008.1 putative glyoxalase superfamily protein PhnB [Burkholderia ambifaria]